MGITWLRIAALAGIGILSPVLEIGDPDWLKADGRDWTQYSPESKQAYLAGFLAGTAAGKALAAGAPDSAALVERVAGLVQSGLAFPFSTNVYGARLDDYYWWENHRSHPIWYALWEVNNDLTRQTDPK